jgi:hypothetical protein
MAPSSMAGTLAGNLRPIIARNGADNDWKNQVSV